MVGRFDINEKADRSDGCWQLKIRRCGGGKDGGRADGAPVPAVEAKTEVMVARETGPEWTAVAIYFFSLPTFGEHCKELRFTHLLY